MKQATREQKGNGVELAVVKGAVANGASAMLDGCDGAALCRIVDAIPQPAFLVGVSGGLLYRNNAAHEYCGQQVPAWLAEVGTRSEGSLNEQARCGRRVRVNAETWLVIVESSRLFSPEVAADSPWARHFKLPPRLARVTACIVCGWSDKEIADRLGLGYQTVRTYVKQIYRRTELHSRAEVISALLSGSYRRIAD